MSSNDSDSSTVWLVAAFGVLLAVVFFFDKSIWPQLDQPLLRCLVAPLAGIVLLIGLYLYSVVLPTVAIEILSKSFMWLTTPVFVFVISLIISLGTVVSLMLGWIAIPVVSLWASIDAVALGTVGGFVIAGLVRAFKSDSQWLQIAISFLVSIGLTSWVITKLQPELARSWIITTIIIVLIFVGRFLYDIDQKAKEVVTKPSSQVDAMFLPQDIREHLLAQIRDQIGARQYDRLVSTIGEDEIINQVLANMRKTSQK